MNTPQLLLLALLIVLIYLIYTYMIKGSSNKLTGLLSAGTPYIVSEDSIKTINGSQNIFNYTTSVWIYVDNWDVTPNLNKPILSIPDTLDIYLGSIDNNLFVDIYPFSKDTHTVDTYSNMNSLQPSPIEGITSMDIKTKKHSKENMQNLTGAPFEEFYGKVSRTSITKNSGTGKEGLTTNEKEQIKQKAIVKSSAHHKEGFNIGDRGSRSSNKFTSVVPAIPLQSWTNITVSIHDKSVDIYINGKLAQSNLFPFVPSPVKNAMTLTPTPGFIGWTSSLTYYPYNLTPSQINNIYTAGYTGSAESLLSLLGKYSMKVVFVDNTQQP